MVESSTENRFFGGGFSLRVEDAPDLIPRCPETPFRGIQRSATVMVPYNRHHLGNGNIHRRIKKNRHEIGIQKPKVSGNLRRRMGQSITGTHPGSATSNSTNAVAVFHDAAQRLPFYQRRARISRPMVAWFNTLLPSEDRHSWIKRGFCACTSRLGSRAVGMGVAIFSASSTGQARCYLGGPCRRRFIATGL